MSYFSIDESIENIKNPYTKKLFKEVYSSYAMGNYRSATVMLWSVVVTDLVHKLKELDSIYNDPKALQILQYIQTEQTKDPKSSKWESEIVDKFHKEINFFETFEVANLEHLQKMRHVSAHPVITSTDLLHSPTKETVYSLIRNALESVLTKEALFSSKILDVIFADLNAIKDTLVTFEDRERYFVHKFLNKMPNVLVAKLIKVLWKFVFKVNDSDVKANRGINLDILKVILINRREFFLDFLQQEKTFISDLKLEKDLKDALLDFVLSNRFIMNFFEDECVQTIHAIIDDGKSAKKYQLIKFERIVDYIDYLVTTDTSNFVITNLDIIENESIENNCIEEFKNLCVYGYCQSSSYAEADKMFEKLITPHLSTFNLVQLKTLIDDANNNSQCCDRWRNSSEHQSVRTTITTLDANFDFTPYSNF
ncbi:hypothetical protein HXZ77_06425 [Acinetobacter johnsonii]|uniref:hypothetical protein n=1 Tax=Acinetobacter johnsonii TaxID=40214 RepID=UPI0025789B62|nr:hypothetical protein [Acinetobacter johnsonii]MDM1250764.1 hypothetical protein [Acinetobacter johnsonii]